jgi:hypothetical protein
VLVKSYHITKREGSNRLELLILFWWLKNTRRYCRMMSLARLRSVRIRIGGSMWLKSRMKRLKAFFIRDKEKRLISMILDRLMMRSGRLRYLYGTKSKSKYSKSKLKIHSYLPVLSSPIAKAPKSYSTLIKRVNSAMDYCIALIEILQFTRSNSKYKSNLKMHRNRLKQVSKRQKVK